MMKVGRPQAESLRVRFDTVVENLNATAKPHELKTFERFIGLEHIIPLDFRVRSWGNTDEGTSFTKVIRPGNTLFSKRRSYLRKVAFSDFSALCSGDVLVFSAKDNKLLPELVPHIVSTNAFYRKAIYTSAGSLSPRTSWRELAGYEFLLPPLEVQQSISEVLKMFEASLESGHQLIQSLLDLRVSIIEDKFDRATKDSRRVQLGDLFSLNNKKLGAHDTEPDIFSISKHDGIVMAENYFNFRVASKALEGYKTLEPNNWAYSTIHIDEGSIARNNTSISGVVSPMYTTMSWIGDHHVPEYLEILLKSQGAISKYISNSQGSLNRRRSLSFSRFARIEFDLPPLEEQAALVKLIRQIDTCLVGVQQEVKNLKMTEIAFTSRIFDLDDI